MGLKDILKQIWLNMNTLSEIMVEKKDKYDEKIIERLKGKNNEKEK